MRILLLAATAVSALAATPAAAAEIFAGVHAHAVKTPLSLDADREDGADFSLGIRGNRIGRTPLQPYVFGSLNSSGGTNFVAAGLSATFGRGRVYVRPGLGIAVHDGSASNFELPDRLAFGSRVLFEPEIAIGTQLTDRVGIEASWVHLSHAQIFGRQNPGIDNIGARLTFKL